MQTFESVDTSIYTSRIAMGGAGGGQFNLNAVGIPTSGNVIRSLQLWYDGRYIRGIICKLSDGQVSRYGTTDSTSEPLHSTETFYIGSQEKLTDLQLWNGKDCFGGLELRTNQNRSFSFKLNSEGDPYRPEIGSGLLVGIFGKAGLDIDCLGLAILRRVESAQLLNVTYPHLDEQMITTTPSDIKTIVYDNDLEQEQKFMFAEDTSVTTSQTWSVTAGLEVAVETEVKAGFPILASGRVKTSLKVTVSGTYQRTNTKTEKQSFQFPIAVPAHTHISATATIYEGNIDVDYKGEMKYLLDSGTEFKYPVEGTYNGVAVSKAVVSVEQI